MKKILLSFFISTLTFSIFSEIICDKDISSKILGDQPVPIELIYKLLPENPVIIEAGAHKGQDTVWMSEMWPQGIIHAFEPTPQKYNLLKETLLQNNICLYQIALGLQTGTVSFYVDDYDGGANSLLPHNQKYLKTTDTISVESIPLDDWATLNKINHIDFMWLDMEGNELNALRSGSKILSTVKAIFIEVIFVPLWHGAPLYQEVKDYMERNHFKQVWLNNKGWNGDALFVNKDLYP